MTITGDAQDLYKCVLEAADAVAADIAQSIEGMTKLHALRKGSEEYNMAWRKAEHGYKTACGVYAKLGELARCLFALEGDVTLNEAECALFSYVKSGDIQPVPPLQFD